MKTEIENNSFELVLRNQRKGAMMTDLSKTMQEAVLAVTEHGEAATVTVTFKISPANSDAGALSVRDEIKSKLPQPKRSNTLFYSTDDGRLVREDPNQEDLKFEVKAAETSDDERKIA